MSAEMLRRAAARLRDLAKVGDPQNYPLPWGTEQADIHLYGVASYVTCEGGKGELTDVLDDDIAEYIAAMNPGVALAFANLLDHSATQNAVLRTEPNKHLLAVASAVLGEAE